MLTAWILYSLLVSALVAVAAWAVEGASRALGHPTRWPWAAAFPVAGLFMLLPFLSRTSTGVGGSGEGVAVAVGPLTLLGFGDGASNAASGWLASLLHVGPDSWWVAAHLPVLATWFLWSGILMGALVLSASALRAEMRGWKRLRLGGRWVFVSEETGPAVVGLGRGQVVVPGWVTDADPAIRDLILDHEEEHRRAGDGVLVLLAAVAVLLMPWNLPLRWCRSRLTESVEVDCDARVLRRHPGQTRLYGTLLIEMGHRGRPPGLPAPAFAGKTSPSLTRRIEMLVHRKPDHPMGRALALTGAGVILLTGACLVPSPEEDVGLTEPELRTETEEVVEAADEDLGSEPQFTPFTHPPDVTNRTEVMEALEAEYPALLRHAGVEGTVMMHFFIDPEGNLQNTRIAESSGHSALDQAALRVADHFQFSPAYNRDEAVPVWIQIPITFTLG